MTERQTDPEISSSQFTGSEGYVNLRRRAAQFAGWSDRKLAIYRKRRICQSAQAGCPICGVVRQKIRPGDCPSDLSRFNSHHVNGYFGISLK